MNKILFLVIFAIFNFQTYEKKQIKITVDNLYSIEIPKFLHKTDSLHSNAQFQYKSSHKNMYIFILHIPIKKAESIDLQEAHDFNMNEIKDKVKYFHSINSVKNIELKNTEGLKDNFYFGKNHIELNVVGIYSQFATIKGKKHLYKIHIWTSAKKIKKYRKVMADIIRSFKEL